MEWPQESRSASLHGGDPFSALAQLKSETAAVWQKDPSHLCTADITFLESARSFSNCIQEWPGKDLLNTSCAIATRRSILANTCHLLPLFFLPRRSGGVPALFSGMRGSLPSPISDALCSYVLACSLARPPLFLYLLVCGN